MPETPNATTSASPKSQTVLWMIAVLLAFIAGLLWTRGPGSVLPAALAQNAPLVGARGVYAFTGQLDRNRFGLFMLDIEQGTIWCYEIDSVGGVRRLRLTAARSWIYDRYLRDFNCADPTCKQVQELVEQQRSVPGPRARGADADNERDPRTNPEETATDGR